MADFLLLMAAMAGLAVAIVGLVAALDKRANRRLQRERDARCYHINRVPVDLVLTGEVIGELCTTCWEQLPVRPKPPKGPSGISPSADGSR